ncbi:cytochrome c oxidase subunit 6A, mitochondrial-like [Nylanderia fulva]|uniref:cytochrome c oxidase subunit 6A, mitochondrial-like n=1 Tax=Nylanderia fulva TaxID=613905 RepID=UPI0010FB2CD9|nr:cytochrome c oxidase subunit 6A, mitochondrial-like [Nylanderia fulva]
MAAWTRAIHRFKKLCNFNSRTYELREQIPLLWKRISFFVGSPAIGLAMLSCYLNHQAHHHDRPPEFIAYDHLRIRTKGIRIG